MAVTLNINTHITYRGIRWTVLSVEPPEVTLVRDDTGTLLTVAYTTLLGDASFAVLDKQSTRARPEKPRTPLWDTLTDKQRLLWERRRRLTEPLILWDHVKHGDLRAMVLFRERYSYLAGSDESLASLTQTELIERIVLSERAEANKAGEPLVGVSRRSILRGLADWREAVAVGQDGMAGLVPGEREGRRALRTDEHLIEIRHPKHRDWVLDTVTTRLPAPYVPIIQDAIERDYLTLRRVSKAALHRAIKARCTKAGLPVLSEHTVAKLADRIDPQLRRRMRDGKAAAALYDPVQNGFSNEEALYPLHMVQLDHTRLDMDVIDTQTGESIGRPWITLGIDVFSRCLWCLYLGFEDPSASVVRKALMQGLFLKQSRERYGTQNEWLVNGKPSIIYMDNGSDFRSAAVRHIINDVLHAEVRYRPVRTPQFGAAIERLVHTVNAELIHSLAGTRKSNPQAMGDYDAEADAAFTLDEVREILVRYFTDIYHFQPHRGLPIDDDTPMVRYLGGLQEVGFPEMVPVEEEARYRLDMLPVLERPYTRHGVRWDNRLYQSPTFTRLIRPGRHKYSIKYDPDDISEIYLLSPDTRQYEAVPAVQPDASVVQGMSLYQWKFVRRKWRETADRKRAQIPATAEVEQAMAALAEDIERKYRSSRRARKQAQKMGVHVSVGPPSTAAPKQALSPRDELDVLLAQAKHAAEARQHDGGAMDES